jgi:hypothetical protein
MSSRLTRFIAALTAVTVAVTSIGLPLTLGGASLPRQSAGCHCSITRVLTGTCCCSAAASGGSCCSAAKPVPSQGSLSPCCAARHKSETDSKPIELKDDAPPSAAHGTCQCQPEEESVLLVSTAPRVVPTALPCLTDSPSLDERCVESESCRSLLPSPAAPPPRPLT